MRLWRMLSMLLVTNRHNTYPQGENGRLKAAKVWVIFTLSTESGLPD